MKKLYAPLALIVLVLLFTSCARDYHVQLIDTKTEMIALQNASQNQANDWSELMPLSGGESGISQNEKQVTLEKQGITTPSSKVSSPENKKTEVKAVTKQVKQVQQTIKEAQKQEKNNSSRSDDDEMILLILLAIFIPPLAVYLYEDSIGTNFWIDLILTLLFWIPGVIFAILVIAGVV